MITYVSFQRPVNILPEGTEYWSAGERRHEGITCTDKGNHLLFTLTTAKGVQRRIKVPLTNISSVTEEGEDKPTKGESGKAIKETP